MIAAEFLGEIVHFIDIIETGQAHCMLVERCVNDGVDLSSFCGGDRSIKAA
jgi:hypothetical protein